MHSTRRGVNQFLAADSVGGSGSAAVEVPAAPDENTAAASTVDYKAKLFALLKLDATADDAAIETALAALPDAAALQTRITGLETELAGATEKISGFEAESNTRKEAEVNALLEEYENLSEEAQTTLREMLMADRAKGESVLSALPKKQKVSTADNADGADGKESASAPSAKSAVPPSPKHDPAGDAQPKSDEDKVTEQNALITKIRGEGKFKDYSAARAEARRQKPDLFS